MGRLLLRFGKGDYTKALRDQIKAKLWLVGRFGTYDYPGITWAILAPAPFVRDVGDSQEWETAIEFTCDSAATGDALIYSVIPEGARWEYPDAPTLEGRVKEAMKWLLDNGAMMYFRPADPIEHKPPDWEVWRADYAGDLSDEDEIYRLYAEEFGDWTPYNTLILEARIQAGANAGQLYAVYMPFQPGRTFTDDPPPVFALALIQGVYTLRRGVKGEA